MRRIITTGIIIAALAAPAAPEAQERRSRGAGPGSGPPPLTGEALEAAKAVVAELLAVPAPPADAMRDFVGTWSGTLEHDGNLLERVSVTFSDNGGEIAGEMRTTSPDGRRQSAPVAFLRVTDTGLEWGVESERFAGGIGVYVMSLEGGDAMIGKLQIRGMQVALPQGMELPEPVVALERSR